MGAQTSKLAIQERFNALSVRDAVPKDDEIWESMLSSVPNSSELTEAEFFTLVTIEDIQRLWLKQPENLHMLLVKVTEKLEGLTRVSMVGTNGTVSMQISNCCRILTRVAPVIYESSNSLDYGELFRRIVDICRSLIHFKGFTTPLNPAPSVIWSEGIGCPVVDRDTRRYSANRIDVLKTLMSVLSSPLYSENNDALEYFTSTTKDPAILCSLLNTALASRNREIEKLSLCLLLISLNNISKSKNRFRWLVSRIHKPCDIEWLAAKLKENLLVAEDKTISIALVWELVQANPVLAGSGGDVVELARLAMYKLSESIDAPDQVQDVRLRAFTLLSLTASNRWCAEAVGPKTLSIILTHEKDLLQPSIELATLVDVLWNCAPSLRLTGAEATELVTLCGRIGDANPTVHKVLRAIIGVMRPLNPGLDASEAPEQGAADIHRCDGSQWNALRFQWDANRIRWYQGIIWGHAYHLDSRIWGRTNVKLFKVTEVKKRPRTVELIDRAASFING